jgi:hypothetical protein
MSDNSGVVSIQGGFGAFVTFVKFPRFCHFLVWIQIQNCFDTDPDPWIHYPKLRGADPEHKKRKTSATETYLRKAYSQMYVKGYKRRPIQLAGVGWGERFRRTNFSLEDVRPLPSTMLFTHIKPTLC